ncbi:MAG: FAD:protein FMN transferase, partial [Candidatus Omnitrophica bacterium]|nr:FAD:protein FMN transferase [Candidatus Omnitrophota bacterium]
RELYKDNRLMMGTFVDVISPDKNAPQIVFTEIKRVENLLSKYNPDSEVAKLNRLGKLSVSPETLAIIKKSYEFWQISDGAFDITVGPLIDLWGFTDKDYHQPTKSEINKALKLVGSNKIIFNNLNNVVEFRLPGMKIDLGAIAKGYALDCAVKKLKENNIKSCLINLGGQVYCLGDRFGKPWRIAMQETRGKNLREILELKNRGISTSGDYEQYFIIDNLRYCHIINPKTGHPADSGIKSVTVVTENNLEADVLSTAIFVLGKAKGMTLANRFPEIKVKIND